MSDTSESRIIDRAKRALREFGDLDRSEAAQLLLMWRHRGLLSDAARAAVLARFPEPPVVTHPDWCKSAEHDPRACVEREQHEGVQVAINPSGDEMVGLRLYLCQLLDSTTVYANLVVSDDGNERVYPLTLGQVALLSVVSRRVQQVAMPAEVSSATRNQGPLR